MALALSEEQQMIQRSAADFCSERASTAELRLLRNAGSAWNRQLWKEMCDLGWGGMLIPAQYGGSELSVYELGLVLIEMGRNLTAAPMVSTALLSTQALVVYGNEQQKKAWLPAIASGKSCFAFALDEGPHYRSFDVKFQAETSEEGFVLNGEKGPVIDGMDADFFILLAKTGNSDALSLFVLPSETAGLTRSPLQRVDSRPAALLKFDSVSLGSQALLGELHSAGHSIEQLLDLATLGVASELLGVTEQAFQMTLGYLTERRQFGVLVGSFQALKHRMADMFCELQLARSAVLGGLDCATRADGRELSLAASLCKSKVGDVARRITAEAIQLHGGIGMTDEHDIGLYLKRSRVLENLFGHAAWHRARYAALSDY